MVAAQKKGRGFLRPRQVRGGLRAEDIPPAKHAALFQQLQGYSICEGHPRLGGGRRRGCAVSDLQKGRERGRLTPIELAYGLSCLVRRLVQRGRGGCAAK